MFVIIIRSSLRPVRASRGWAEIQRKGKSSEPCPSPNLGILILQDSCQRMKSLADFSLHVFDHFLVQPLLLFVLFFSFQSAWHHLYAHVHYLRTIYLPCLCLQTSFHYLTTFQIFNASWMADLQRTLISTIFSTVIAQSWMDVIHPSPLSSWMPRTGPGIHNKAARAATGTIYLTCSVIPGP